MFDALGLKARPLRALARKILRRGRCDRQLGGVAQGGTVERTFALSGSELLARPDRRKAAGLT
jgi:hypothetical protein